MSELTGLTPEERAAAKKHGRARHYLARMRPSERVLEVLKRSALGVYNVGFIHAGNLAYLALTALFPFFIVAAAVAALFGQDQETQRTVATFLRTLPADTAELLRKPISDVLNARSGNLLWLGALVGLWTTGSFIETIRDILHRAYGVVGGAPFWEYRLLSIGLIVASVVMMVISFSLSIVLSSVTEFIARMIPRGEDLIGLLTLFRVLPGLVLFGSIYLIFVSLTPRRYRKHQCKKWPGALFVTLWWMATTSLLPIALSSLGGYDLTYGSLADVIIALLFFFVIGFGVVIGAQLNAALAEPPEPSVHEDDAEKGAEETT